MTDLSVLTNDQLKILAQGGQPDLSNFSNDQLKAAAAAHDEMMAQQAPKPNMLGRIGNDLSAGWDKIKQADQANMEGTKSTPRAAADIIGAGGQAIGNIGLDVIGSVGRELPWTNLSGQQTNATELAQRGLQAAAQSQPGQFIGRQVQTLNKIAPDAMAVGGDLLNAFGAAPAGKLLGGISEVGSELGNVVRNTGQGIIDARKAKAIQDLVSPIENKTELTNAVPRTAVDPITGAKTILPDNSIQNSIDAVSSISGINSPLKNYQQKWDMINQVKNQEADNLIQALKSNDVKIPLNDINNKLFGVKDALAKNPYLVGNAETSVDRVMNIARDSIIKNGNTASGLLQARKDFDNALTSLKPKVYDPTTSNPVSDAALSVRRGINDLIDQAVPDAGVKASLAKQSAMYDALDNIAPKAAREGNNKLSRMITSAGDTVSNVTGVTNPITKGALELGALGGLGATTAFAPAVLGVGATAYGTAKALPYAMKAAGKVMQAPEYIGNKFSSTLQPILDKLTSGVKVDVNTLPAPQIKMLQKLQEDFQKQKNAALNKTKK